MKPADRDGFTIAIICALSLEAEPVEALFDEIYDQHGEIYGKQFRDPNSYTTGRIGSHNVVLSYMPGIGRGAAASVASSLRVSYTGVQLALVVGICGAAPCPSDKQQIFLGDVIISDSVIQYDFGRQYPGGFQRKMGVKDTLGRPGQEISSFLERLRGPRSRSRSILQAKISEHVQLLRESEYELQLPGSDDVLFDPSFTHKHRRPKGEPFKCVCFDEDRPDDACAEAIQEPCGKLDCDENHIIRRRAAIPLTSDAVSIHIGTIASGDTVMKSGEGRDKLVGSEKVLGFEMEGAGVWDNIPCIVIKGVCDYADSHKSEDWQEYAAGTGAAAAKAFLSIFPMYRKDLRIPLNRPRTPRSSCFVGRTAELDEISEVLFSGDLFDRALLLQGPPGVGKSSLAAEYVEKSHQQYETIFWLDSSSPLNLASGFSMARTQINNAQSVNSVDIVHDRFLLQSQSEEGQSLGDWDALTNNEDIKVIQEWLRRNESWLLVFDNYCPPDKDTAVIETFFSQAKHGHIIITTQFPLTEWRTIRLRNIERYDDASQIISETSRRQDLLADRSLPNLIAQIDGLPLALASAGAYLSQNNEISCREYLKRYNKDWLQLQRDSPQLPSYHSTLRSCWANTFDKLIEVPEVWTMLQIWACLDSQDLWFELLDGSLPISSEGNSMTTFDQAVSLLREYGIVEASSRARDQCFGSQGYSLNRCFHAWLKNRFVNVDIQESGDLALSTVNKCSEGLLQSSRDNYTGLLRLLPHAKRCFDLVVDGKTRHRRSVTTTFLLFDDTYDLIKLSRIFEFAGYGKSRSESAALGGMRLPSPGRTHLLKAETLLVQAQHKLEQAGILANNESHEQQLDFPIIYLLQLSVLGHLRHVYIHISEPQKVGEITPRLFHLYYLTNQRWKARMEITSFYSFMIYPAMVEICYFVAIALNYLIWGRVIPANETVSDIRQVADVLFLLSSHVKFWYGWGDRRITFPSVVFSLLLFAGYDMYYVHDQDLTWIIGGIVIPIIVPSLVMVYFIVFPS